MNDFKGFFTGGGRPDILVILRPKIFFQQITQILIVLNGKYPHTRYSAVLDTVFGVMRTKCRLFLRRSCRFSITLAPLVYSSTY